MGLIERFIETRSGLTNPQSWLKEALGVVKSSSGVDISERNVLEISGYYACVRVLSDTIASLPLHSYTKIDEGGKAKAKEHPHYKLLHSQPNPEMTSFTWREIGQGHLSTWGNFYNKIEWGSDGYAKALYPIPPNIVTVERNRQSNNIQYRVQVENGEKIIRAEDMLHIPGFGFDGLIGHSPVDLHRDSIGLTKAAEKFGAKFFGNGAKLGGVIEYPGKFKDQGAVDRLKSSFNRKHQGVDNSHKVAVLEEGMTYKEIGIPPEQAQFLETRKFQLNEMARIFRIPPHMIGDLERATFSNVEQQSIDFVVHTIRPWLVRWEQAINSKLFSGETQQNFYCEFLVDGLLRGDIKSRYEAYAIARQNGVLNGDEWRELENMNPIEDGSGKLYLVNSAMVSVEAASQAQPKPNNTPAQVQQKDDRSAGPIEKRAIRSVENRVKLAATYKRLFEEAAGRVVRREVHDIKRAAEKHLKKRSLTEFREFLEEYYRDFEKVMENNLTPVFTAYAEQIHGEASREVDGQENMSESLKAFIAAYVANYITSHIGSSRGQIREVLAAAGEKLLDPFDQLEKRLDEWQEKRAGKIAHSQVVQSGGAVAKATYTENGVMKVKWRSSGGNCPICNSLDGKTVTIGQNFLNEGETIEGGEGQEPLTAKRNIGHPPIHRGCDCMIVASN